MLDVSSYMFSSIRSHIHSENWAYLLDVFFEYFRDTSEALEVEFKLKLKVRLCYFVLQTCPFLTHDKIFECDYL